MRAGKLCHRITIEYQTETEDEYGAPVVTWVPIWQLWAQIQPLTGREYWAAQQVQAEMTHRVLTRWHPGWRIEPGVFITPAQLIPQGEQVGITPTARIRFRGRVFNIISVADIEEKHEYLEIRCIEALTA